MSFTISKTFQFAAAHVLDHLPDTHPCARLHGHNYTVEVELASDALDSDGMVLDYRALDAFKEWIDKQVDHRNLNELDTFAGEPTTAECIARRLYEAVRETVPAEAPITAVRVYETPKTSAEYRP